MKFAILFFAFAMVQFNAPAATAADCQAKAPRGQTWKTCKNTVRADETVEQYLLTKNGNLFALLKRGGALCQVTSDVDNFKISQHPKDAAVLYFDRNDDLYVLNKEKVNFWGDCPKTSKKVIMENVKEYKIATNTKTTIVNAALNKFGKFVAWDNTSPVYTAYGVADFQMNNCFGKKGSSFNSYVLFTQDFAGFITKVKGKADWGVFEYIADSTTKGRFDSITAFKDKENVCQ